MKFKKEIIRLGKYVLPDGSGEIDVDDDRLTKWLESTRAAGVKTYVPYRHSRDPRDNCGFIEGFEVADGVLYGVFDITDEDAAKKIEDGTIKDVSIGVGAVLKENGEKYDEVIKHVALVMEPHVKDQGEFQALMESDDVTIAFSAGDLIEEEDDLELKLANLEARMGHIEFRAQPGTPKRWITITRNGRRQRIPIYNRVKTKEESKRINEVMEEYEKRYEENISGEPYPKYHAGIPESDVITRKEADEWAKTQRLRYGVAKDQVKALRREYTKKIEHNDAIVNSYLDGIIFNNSKVTEAQYKKAWDARYDYEKLRDELDMKIIASYRKHKVRRPVESAEEEFGVKRKKKRKHMESLKGKFGNLLGKVGINVFKPAINKGGEHVADKHLEEKVDELNTRFEALLETKAALELERDEWVVKFEAAETERDEAKAKVAEFEAEKKKAEEDARLAFEAEAEKFEEVLMAEMKDGAEPATKGHWRDLYLANPELAKSTAKKLKIKFEGEAEGEAQSPPQPKASDKEKPGVVEVLKAMGYPEDRIEEHLKEMQEEE